MSGYTTAGRGPGRRLFLGAGAAVALAGFVAAGSTPARAASVNLLETGSSLLYPLFNLWVPAYTKANPGVRITTQSTGSGTGISESISGVAQIGASDAYLSDALMKQHAGMLNIPLAISSQMINYNVPGLNATNLKFSGPVLAGIYSGKITKWNDPAIAAINPGVKLPDHAIVTVHRTDGSGDTFIFSQYLAFSTPAWQNSVGYGTTVSWPAAAGAIGANGNPGMVNAIKNTPYSIAYIGVSFKQAIADNKLGTALLENKDGKFVPLTIENVKAAAAAMTAKTPKDERISLVYAPGPSSYPIINYEYAIVKAQQPNAAVAAELRKFFTWAISPQGGNAQHFMDAVSFVALPASAAKLSTAQIDTIK
ncbi:MAG: phosphate ABC transporter substrate-binding protein PstS [Rhodospirillales bacterium]|nr:phosphate ABC transporter substrate-binding protein PstS [Rhodospirillales bacterium]